MIKSIAIIATLDTKGDQVEYLKRLIEEDGHNTVVIDVGILGNPSFQPTISHDQVAQAAGTNLKEIIALNWELKAMEKMAEGACNIVKELCSGDKLNGVLAVGGSMGTSLALKVMKVVPIGIPKLILSTIAYSPTINPNMLCADLMMLLWIGGLWGINSLSIQSLETAAGAISGAAKLYDKKRVTTKKLIAVTGIGWSVKHYMKQLKPGLEERGYEVAMFHATGMSGRALEQAIYDGSIAAVLDLAVGGELLNYVVGTAFSPGEHRLEAAGKMGIPQIVGVGAIEVFFWGADRPLPARYRDRAVPRPHNYLLMQVGASTKHQAAVGKLMAEKLNMATGPAVVIIPAERSSADVPKGAMPAAFKPGLGLKVFHKSLMRNLKPEVKVVRADAGESEPLFVEKVLSLFDEMMGIVSRG
jgi:uncharacterized protein (UPF0261 family)